MTIGIFTNKNHTPSADEIAAALGSKKALWDRLVLFIAESYQLPENWTYGGKNYGWNLWYRKGGKSLVSLYPQKDGFVAQVVLGKAEVEKALALSLGENVGKVLRETAQLHDGRWLFIAVKTETDAADVEQLLAIKRKPKKSI